jgi:molybdopterin guanine dinucleotide-containing S/N-oxide reductase-like protein
MSEKTVIKALAMPSAAMNGSPSAVDVKDGKVIRIRPLHYDSKYTKEEIKPFEIKARGKTFQLPMKSMPPHFAFAWKKRTYSPNRIKYPLKRVDWDPNGERNIQNRGKSKYKRISWDEATDLIVSEVKRVQEKYGPFAILAEGEGHGQSKMVHFAHSCQRTLLQYLGGFTSQVRNADSWEGWYYGAKHVWGEGYVGMQRPKSNLFKDVSENTDLLIWWGGDPETTCPGFSGHFVSNELYWFTELGIEQIWISPELNYSAAVHGDKWIPVLPDTDAAIHLAIAYTWIKEGTYDKEYVKTHVVGFDKFSDYVMGKEDGVPKTPGWASPKCGVPEWTIKALARVWASKATSIGHHYGGSYIRGPYSSEPARLEVCLLGMQGVGKPGRNMYYMAFPAAAEELPRPLVDVAWFDLFALSPGASTEAKHWDHKQIITKTMLHKAILNPPVSFYGTTHVMATKENQFVKYTYPIPKEEGGTEIHMIWTDTPCNMTCWNEGNLWVDAFRSPKIECIIAQHPWLENDCLFADIILPITTKLEEEDIAVNLLDPIRAVTIEKQAIPKVGESLSDYEAVGEIAKKFGKYKEYTWGRTNLEIMKLIYEKTGVKKHISWEKLYEKEYWPIPTVPGWEKDPAGHIKFYQDPVKNPLDTPSGKMEFYSAALAEHFPDDKERPPNPKWIEGGTGWTHDERLSSARAKKYRLLIMSNHGRWRVHAQCDDVDWFREIQTCKVQAWDGYKYEPCWLNPKTAAERGIKHGDIVKVFNERGTVLGGAYVTERMMPGVAYMDHGARVDWIIPGKLDRGGAINLISPAGTVSKNCFGQATSGYLGEVKKVTMAEMEEWKEKYPEAFEREYDPASGLRFNAWVEGGGK